MVMSTSVHPRMGVLVQTLSKTLDDLLHLGLLQGLFFGTFAFLTYINYGGEAFDFSTFTVTLTTLLQITLGNVPGDLTLFDDTSMYFVLIFLFINNFIVLNFIIAIIVDAYAKVQEAIQSDDSERAFLVDVVMVHVAIALGWRQGWHSIDQTIRCLDTLSMAVVSPEDVLLARRQLGLEGPEEQSNFAENTRARAAMRHFFDFYRWFGVETEQAKEANAYQADATVKALCTALRVPVPGPWEVVQHTERKKSTRARPSEALKGSGGEPPVIGGGLARTAPADELIDALKGQVSALQRLARQQEEEISRLRSLEDSTTGTAERIRVLPQLVSEAPAASARRWVQPEGSPAHLQSQSVTSRSRERLPLGSRVMAARATRAVLVEQIAEREATNRQMWADHPASAGSPAARSSPAGSCEVCSSQQGSSRPRMLPFLSKPENRDFHT